MSQKEKPLLVMEYKTGKVLWKLFFPYGLAILISLAMLLGDELSLQEDGSLKFWFGIIFFGIIFLISLISVINILLLKEIRLYELYMEKELLFFGTTTSKYENLKLLGMYSYFVKAFNFIKIDESNIFKRKFCSCDLNLISNLELEKFKEILSSISNRSKNEFEVLELKINPLIKNKNTRIKNGN